MSIFACQDCNVDPYPNLSGKVRIFGNIMLWGGQTRHWLCEHRAVPLHS